MQSSLLKNSLTKLREYHGCFKSICDTFAINNQDFDKIFGLQENSRQNFEIWLQNQGEKSDKNVLVNALEVSSNGLENPALSHGIPSP